MKRLIVLGSVLALALLMTLPAQAAGGTPLKLFSSDTGAIQWSQHTSDSPLDGNHARLSSSVALQDGNDYTVAYTDPTVLGAGVAIGKMHNLSFDFNNTLHVGAGAPRISVDLSNATEVYLAGSYCNTTLVQDTTWSRADFTGQTTAGCDIYTSETGFVGPFSSGSGQSAWKAFVAAYAPTHPGVKATDAYFVQDEEGIINIDRLALYNTMWTAPGPGGIVSCIGPGGGVQEHRC